MRNVKQDKIESAKPEQPSRRKVLKGVIAGATVTTAGISGFAASPLKQMFAAAVTTHPFKPTPVQDILNIARTAERLAVTFYSNGLANVDKLGLKGDEVAYLRAALVEEQIHEFFFRDNGGKSLASEFSFPHGPETFTKLEYFIQTQQQLEGVFDSAFLAAVREFALQNQSRLAQIAAQIATVEAEHRVLGRVILGKAPADNWAFTPVDIASVAEAPGFVTRAGYLSPRKGNTFTYAPVGITYSGVTHRTPDILSY